MLRPRAAWVVVGFNPASLWGLRQRLGCLRLGLGLASEAVALPPSGEFLGYRRLRDRLQLLSFRGRSGPPAAIACRWPRALAAALRLDGRAGRALVAGIRRGLLRGRRQARVRGMRLVGLAREQRQRAGRAVVATHKRREREEEIA